MKTLLDEQLHVDLKHSLSFFNVFELKDFNWNGLKNGELREKMNENDFAFFITADKKLPFNKISTRQTLPLFCLTRLRSNG